MREITLGNRLLSVARLVRQGAVFADVGTDHAYLPLYLFERGAIDRAICSDINEGPLENARANARARGYEEKIDFILTDGAAALSPSERE
ncbi:MAG: SAM-dependent methyltransferase [Clostridia bacterium]|nr:SAM-dependent methyltransferase [Clostridia bacterium]